MCIREQNQSKLSDMYWVNREKGQVRKIRRNEKQIGTRKNTAVLHKCRIKLEARKYIQIT